VCPHPQAEGGSPPRPRSQAPVAGRCGAQILREASRCSTSTPSAGVLPNVRRSGGRISGAQLLRQGRARVSRAHRRRGSSVAPVEPS
jgi:hypothetical protein